MNLALAQSDRAAAGTAASIPFHNQQNQSSLPVSSRNSEEGNFVGHSRQDSAGNFPADAGRSSPAYRITQAQYRRKSAQSFWDHWEGRGRPRHPARYIADKIECSPKTAQSWLDGDTTPAGILDLRAMASIPEYAALKREIAAMEMDLDPRVQRKLHELQALMAMLADGRLREPLP